MGAAPRRGRAASYMLAAVLGGVIGGGSVRLLDRTAARGTLAAPGVAGGLRPYTEVVESGTPASHGEQVVQVVRQVGPAVVNIDTLSRAPDGSGFAFFEEIRQGQGSGFIVNGREGLVVTNAHVVEGTEGIRVTLADKRAFRASVVGTDLIGDIALIKIDGRGPFPEVKFGNSDRLEIGQLVVAIGNALGLQNTVTQGVLSQTGRQLDGHIQGIPLDDLIQTDAAINPGNSGGPLLDGYGRVIGMNTAIISQAQGIGFAVAANTVKRAITDILGHGRVIRSWIGVQMASLTPGSPAPDGRPPRRGVVITGVRPGEPAHRGGLRPRDVITEANGRRAESSDELRQLIRELRPGAVLRLKGLREGRATEWRVVVGEMPPPDQLSGDPRLGR